MLLSLTPIPLTVFLTYLIPLGKFNFIIIEVTVPDEILNTSKYEVSFTPHILSLLGPVAWMDKRFPCAFIFCTKIINRKNISQNR